MAADAFDEDFVRGQGLPFLAHLLRRVADRMISEAGMFYARQGISAPARTASTLLLLSDQGPQGVTELAAKLRQSHPLAITWIRQLRKLGFVKRTTDPADKRRSLVSLTPQGEEETRRMREALSKLGRAYRHLLDEAGKDLFENLWRLNDISSEGELLRGLLALAEEDVGRGAASPAATGARRATAMRGRGWRN